MDDGTKRLVEAYGIKQWIISYHQAADGTEKIGGSVI
jgi:hypothetical protein